MTTPDLARRETLPQGSHKARGVVLRRREGSAKSFELLLFLAHFGAVWVGAPGADGAKNRFGGGTEPMVWGEFDLYQSPRRLYLKGVDVREDFFALRRSRRALTASIAWCGALSSRLPLGMENDALLSLFWGVMKNLAAGVAPALLDVRLAWRWANLWGVAPPLERCADCGASLLERGDEVFRFDDGLLCASCERTLRREAGSGDFFSKSLTPAVLREICHSAMLPRDRFLIWSRETAITDGAALKETAAWLYKVMDGSG